MMAATTGCTPPGRAGPGRRFAGVLACLWLAACAVQGGGDPGAFLYGKGLSATPSPDSFSLCRNHDCLEILPVSLTREEWALVTELFVPFPEDGAAERQQIAMAIGALEVLTGPRIGTENERGGSFNLFSEGHQFDCYDTTANTTTYLFMLNDHGLLRHHRIGGPLLRGWFVFGWPHASASIVDRESGFRFAVDSWHFDNGSPSLVVPFEEWVAPSWSPGPAPERLTLEQLKRLAGRTPQPASSDPRPDSTAAR